MAVSRSTVPLIFLGLAFAAGVVAGPLDKRDPPFAAAAGVSLGLAALAVQLGHPGLRRRRGALVMVFAVAAVLAALITAEQSAPLLAACAGIAVLVGERFASRLDPTLPTLPIARPEPEDYALDAGARKVLGAASGEARRVRARAVDAEHLLLALLAEPAIAAAILGEVRDLEALRAAVDAHRPASPGEPPAAPPPLAHPVVLVLDAAEAASSAAKRKELRAIDLAQALIAVAIDGGAGIGDVLEALPVDPEAATTRLKAAPRVL